MGYLSCNELLLIAKGTVLRGYTACYSLLTHLMPITLLLLALCCFSYGEEIVFLIASALCLLLSRASSVRKDVSYLFCSEKTIVITIWTIIALFTKHILYICFAHLLPQQGNFFSLMPFLISLFTLAPFGQGLSSIWLFVWASFLLDTIPSITSYGRATYQAFRMILQRIPLFFAYTLCIGCCYQSTLWLIQQTPLPFAATRSLVDLLLLPWHSAALAQIYSYIRYSEE